MKKKWLQLFVLGTLGALISSPSGAIQDTSQDKYQFRITVDLISLNVTVTDTRNRFITELARDNFSVYEDGVKQEVSVFSQEDLPLRMVLLMDTSASMEEKISSAQEAAIRFVGTLKEEEDDIEDDISFLGFYPVVSLSANLRF